MGALQEDLCTIVHRIILLRVRHVS